MLVRLGVDIGGTNTDAVILRDNQVLSWYKAPTTKPDVTGGLEEAMQGALRRARDSHGTMPDHIKLCMLGTTHFVNALVERRGLAPVAVLRLCLPATSDLPPFSDMPASLVAQLGGGAFRLVHGGLEYDGEAEISPVKDSEVLEAAEELIERQGYRSVVVSGVFSPLAPHKQEDHACALIASRWPEVVVTASHQVSPLLGLLERENAAILNACLRPLASRLLPQCLAAFSSCLNSRSPPLFLTSNDGTLLTLQAAAALPLATFQSGPVNSIRGAAYLCHHDPSFTPHPGRNLVVIDVGGTTTDFGLVASTAATISGSTSTNKGLGSTVNIAQQQRLSYLGGVRTNLPLPAVNSIGLGGGSLVTGGDQGRVRVGPESVGSELLQRCRSGGGRELVATDVAIAVGALSLEALGLSSSSAQAVDDVVVREAWQAIQAMAEEGLDGAKTRADPVDVMVVGGGAFLVGDTISGAARLWRPAFGHVANAIGAAIPQVGQTIDQVVMIAPTERGQILKQLEEQAIDKVVAAGGLRETCQVTWREEIPLAYLPGHATRVRMRVVGDLDTSRLPSSHDNEAVLSDLSGKQEPSTLPALAGHKEEEGEEEEEMRTPWLPKVDEVTGEWVLTRRDVKAIAVGTGVLGAGGGGSSYLAKVKLLRAMKARKSSPRVVQADSIRDESMVIEGGHMGAPTVSIEKLSAGEAKRAFLAAAEACCQGEVEAVLVGEVGGGNGLEPLSIGLNLGLPVIDADLMGRAFPELHMMTPNFFGLTTTPAALADERGNTVIVSNVSSHEWVERLLRPVCTVMGCHGGFSSRPLTGREVKTVGVKGSLSLAWRIGRAVMQAGSKDQAAEAILGAAGGKVLFGPGKIVDVERWTEEGFARGYVMVEGGGGPDERLRVEFQNENLVATREGPGINPESPVVLCAVPDLIVLLETSSGLPLQTEDLRYGVRVVVLGLPCHELLRTPEALAVVGPQAFGYPHVTYTPLPLPNKMTKEGDSKLWPFHGLY